MGKYGIDEVSVRLVKDKRWMSDIELKDSESVYLFFRNTYEEWDREVALLLNLNSQLMPISFTHIATGSINSCYLSVRECLRASILSGCSGVVFLHTHPSGIPKPSREDIALTDELVKAYGLVNIPLYDHIILGESTYFSFKEKEILPYFKTEQQFSLDNVSDALKYAAEHSVFC